MRPFPELPYGYAPSFAFPLTEFSVFVFMILCLLHARRRGIEALSYLLGGFLFGVTLETFEVMTGSYTYGHFAVMLPHPIDVPLWVGCAWAVIMYTARLFSDAARLPLFAAAAFDTLLGLNIDLSIDVVAYRMHMWHWDWNGSGQNPLTAQWFGIPYGNFVGWITVIFCYSAFSRLFWRSIVARRTAAARPGMALSALTTLLSILASVGVLVLTELAVFGPMNKIGFTSGPRFAVSTAALILLAFLGWRNRQPGRISLGVLAQWFPAWFHGLFVAFFFALGFYRENKWMTLIGCINLLAGIGLHILPKLASAGSAAQPEPVSIPAAPAAVINEA